MKRWLPASGVDTSGGTLALMGHFPSGAAFSDDLLSW